MYKNIVPYRTIDTRCRCANAVSFYAEMKSLFYMFALASNKRRWKRKSLCARFCELVKFGETQINLNDRAFLVFIYNEKSSAPNYICLTYNVPTGFGKI